MSILKRMENILVKICMVRKLGGKRRVGHRRKRWKESLFSTPEKYRKPEAYF